MPMVPKSFLWICFLLNTSVLKVKSSSYVASLCFHTPSSKGVEIVSLLDPYLASLSLFLLTLNKAEFEEEVRNGNICPDTTI